MEVKELIDKLKTLPQNAKVMMSEDYTNPSCTYYMELQVVELVDNEVRLG